MPRNASSGVIVFANFSNSVRYFATAAASTGLRKSFGARCATMAAAFSGVGCAGSMSPNKVRCPCGGQLAYTGPSMLNERMAMKGPGWSIIVRPCEWGAPSIILNNT